MIGWKLYSALAVAVALGAGVQQLRIAGKDADIAKLRAEHANTISAINVAGASFAAAMRATEQNWAERLEKESSDGQTRINTALAAAAAARAAAGSLRAAADRYRAAARAAAHPGATAVGPSATDALDLFADLFARADDRAGELARVADLAHAAGLTCERAYDALRDDTPPP